jgi:outer membrane protein assembly complex protein YaeT
MQGRFATATVAAFVLVTLATLVDPREARADVAEYLGKAIATVTLQSEGRVVSDPRVLALVETRPGAPLSVADVRESIAHLLSIGQFEDVQVHAAQDGSSVTLTYVLVPFRPITAIVFQGDAPGVDRDQLRRRIAERFGVSPRAARAGDVAAFVTEELRDLGYLQARVAARVDVTISTREAALVFALAAGDRTRIGEIDIQGDPGMTVPELLRTLRISSGAPFHRAELNERLDRYLAASRQRGFYAARARLGTELADSGRFVDLTLTVALGPRVVVRFDGDPLPPERHHDLVPLASEGSADQDLVEDSAARIREYLQSQGYRDGSVTYVREEKSGELVITFTVKKGPQYRVGRVEFSGNVSVPLTDLQPRLLVRPGQPFSLPAVDADLATVEDIYRRQGFSGVQADATFDSQPAAAGAIDVPVAIRVVVTENVRTLVGAVRVEGVSAVPEAELAALLGLRPGAPFFAGQMAADRDAIQLRLANLGYQSATVVTVPRVSPDGARADVVFNVREGPQVLVDHVIIAGNERIKTATIQRELQFASGEPLGLERINESQRRLAALGLFRRARITELSHGDEARRDVLVTVDEAPVQTIGYGGGLEAGQFLRTDEETGAATERLELAPRGFFEIGRRNLFGKNRSINLFTRVSLRNQFQAATSTDPRSDIEYRVIGTFREPRVFQTTADAFLTATIEQQARTSFNFTRRAFNAEVARRLTRTVSVTGSYQIQRTELFDEQLDPESAPSVTSVDRVFPQVRLSSFAASIVRDTRDDLADPTAGRFLSANTQLAGRRIGSEVGFARSFFTAQLFRTLPRAPRVVLATNARIGMAAAFPRLTPDRDADGNPVFDPNGQPVFVTVRDLPASERFFAGGDTTVRGFTLDRLGTPDLFDKNGFPTGGGGLVVLNAEVRVPIRWGFGAVGFVDAGNVFAQPSSISLTELRSSVGLGLRYRSPIGPVRVDLGFKLHRNVIANEREPLTALHISLGQAF